VANVRGDAENAIWGKRANPVPPIAGIGESLARNVILGMAGVGIVCLSFWITLTLIDSRAQYYASDVRLADVPLTNLDGSLRSARATKLSDLPAPPAVAPFSAGWDGIEGLNALILGAGPTGGGNQALSLVATRDNGRHRLGISFAGFPTNRPVHAIAWIKAPPGTRVSVDARDAETPGHPSQNGGWAATEVSPPKLLGSRGNLHATIGPGPSNWAKMQIDLPSSNGVFVIYLNLLAPPNSARGGGADLQIIFGGIELTVG
jgi:hypothetical protein